MGFFQILLSLPTFPGFVAYLVVVLSYRYWKSYIPTFNLSWLMRFHNALCCVLSAVTAAIFSVALHQSSSVFDRTPSPLLVTAFNIYWATKILEVADTVFMMLRKSTRQVRSGFSFQNALCCALSAVTAAIFSVALHQSSSVFDRTPSPLLVTAFNIYWATKILEVADTVFMMLRKSTRQISTLHIYHHSAMLLLSDYARTHSPWPCMAYVLSINSVVHIFVYAYYYRASDPSKPPLAIGYKKALTLIQMAQFSIALVYCTIGYARHNFCAYSIFFDLTMFAMFGNFYYRTYIVGKGQPRLKNKDGDLASGDRLRDDKEK